MDEEVEKLKKLESLLSRAGQLSDFLARKISDVKFIPPKPTLNPVKPKKFKSTSKLELPGLRGIDYEPNVTDIEGISIRQAELVPLVTGGVLRDYQMVGLEWLISIWENGINGILADEMGLGKTLQTISFLAYLRSHGIWGPFLIVAPLSTLNNWVSEIRRFTPTIPVLMYHGNQTQREELRQQYMTKMNEHFPWIVTSYEVAMNDSKHMRHFKWKYIIIDEGHRIKNLDCKLIKELKSYQSANRLLLTGTPLQNNLKELWALLNFLMPTVFTGLEDFMSWFDFEDGFQDAEKLISKEKENSIISNLHNILKPFLLRRIKNDVAKDLPRKVEFIVYCPMTIEQNRLYAGALKGTNEFRRIILNKEQPTTNTLGKRERTDHDYKQVSDDDDYFNELENIESKPKIEKQVTKSMNQMKLQNLAIQLRKICNHPLLFDIPIEDLDDVDTRIHNPINNIEHIEPVYECPIGPVSLSSLPPIIKSSGKMIVLERLLTSLLSRGHKVLIFSQMTRLLDILEDYLEEKQWPYCRIDGNVAMQDRQVQIQEFQNGSNIRVFLLSTRSGGLGINLTAADSVIIYDSDWNPQMDLQAQDRVHRIGQKKPVNIYRFVTSNSIEQVILSKASDKRKLERLVIHRNQFKGSSQYYSAYKKLDVDDMKQLITMNQDVSVLTKNNKMEYIHDVINDKELETILSRNDIRKEEVVGVGFTILEGNGDQKNDILVGLHDHNDVGC